MADAELPARPQRDSQRDDRAAQPRGLAQNRKQAGDKVSFGFGRRFHLRAIMPLVCEKLGRKHKTADESFAVL